MSVLLLLAVYILGTLSLAGFIQHSYRGQYSVLVGLCDLSIGYHLIQYEVCLVDIEHDLTNT